MANYTFAFNVFTVKLKLRYYLGICRLMLSLGPQYPTAIWVSSISTQSESIYPNNTERDFIFIAMLPEQIKKTLQFINYFYLKYSRGKAQISLKVLDSLFWNIILETKKYQSEF